MNGSLPEKSEPLLSTRYEPLAREAKMPKAQLSRALAVSYFEFQLDILTKLAVPTGTFSRMRDVDVNRLLASRSLESTESSPKNPNILGEIVRNVRIRSHGSVGRTHWSSYQTAGSLVSQVTGPLVDKTDMRRKLK